MFEVMTPKATLVADPRGRGTRNAGAGHLLLKENSSELNSAVIDFWESLDHM